MANNFNLIAPVYDALAYAVFGRKQIDAKLAFLNLIPAGSHVLIVGGGTGNILNELLSTHETIHVDFLEPSRRMIAVAKKNLDRRFESRVAFVEGSHSDLATDARYDVVTSFFLLDMFRQHDALVVAQRLRAALKPDGLWLYADFRNTDKALHRFLLWSMYRFFKVTVNISANRLPDADAIFRTLGLCLREEKLSMNGFIASRVYTRA